MKNISKESLVQLVTTQVLAQIERHGREGAVTAEANYSHTEATVIEGIVTARKLEGLSAVAIDSGSIITPSAKDYIKEKKIQVQATLSNINVANNPSCGTYHFWSVCSDFASLGNRICNELNIVNIPNRHRPDEIEFVLGVINSAIENNSQKGGIIVVDTSPMAMFATRSFSALRPIVGNYPKTIEDGVSQIDANLLILEKQYLGRSAIHDLTKQFITLKKSASPYGRQVLVGGSS